MRVVAGLSLLFTQCLEPNDDDVGTRQYGEACDDVELCARGLVCAGDDVCRVLGEPGTSPLGGPCVATDFCQQGLVCAGSGTCDEPGAAGTSGVGETCADASDCQLGLYCEDTTCFGLQLPLWFGEECEQPELDAGAFRVYFEVPGEVRDFYRLPFPNDARMVAGHPDLSGHPTPGPLVPIVGDPVQTVVDALEADLTGWGNNQVTLLRFSDSVNFDTLEIGLPGTGTVGIVDVTPGDTFGELSIGRWTGSTGRGQYICHNWLALEPMVGRPFAPGHTYAAYITTGVQDTGGVAVAADADFGPMLLDTAPADARLGRAWSAYAPLRAWLAEADISPATIAGAAVFTVGDPTAPVRALRDAVHAAPAPVASAWHVCDGAGGPYATEADRGCSGATAPFTELQGTVSLPRFQTGTPPFKDAADGGGIDFAGGVPSVQGTESVVVSLTIPTGEMPEDGWPLVVYAHGTGGNYQSGPRDGTATLLSSVTLDDSTEVRFATLSFDAVLHGDRRHPENWDAAWLDVDPHAYDPDVLFFNPLNPRAARDNSLQAAADVFALVRWATAFDVPAEASPTGAAIRFDPDHLAYLGHSQGAVTGVAPFAYEPDLDVAVLSGGGALFIESLLHKTSPNDLSAAIAVGLADPGINRVHPVLNLAQAWVEPADAVNHAAYVLGAENPEDIAPRSVFQVYGVGDTYSPDETQIALARALRVPQAPGTSTPLESVSVATLPVSANRAAGTVTGLVALYERVGGRDAHFVFFDRADTRRQVSHFLATSVVDDAPTVVAP